MNSKVQIKIVSVIVIVLVIAIIFGLNNKNYGTAEIKLTTNGGVSCKWEYVIEDDSIVKCKEVKTESEDPDVDGGIVYQYYCFEGLKEGTTIITFEYKDILDNFVKETKKYNVSVDEHMKIRITQM